MNLHELEGGLWVLDLDRRTYAALSRDGSYWHLIRPRRAEDAQAGAWREVGVLMCNCAGAQRHGRCYRVEEAEKFERQLDDSAWGLAPSPLERVPEPVA